MAWTPATPEEIAELRAAVYSGVLEVEYTGPPERRIKYQSLQQMRDLLASLTRDRSQPSYRFATHDKGFR